MPYRKFKPKTRKPKTGKSKSTGRRKLTFTPIIAGAGLALAKKGYNKYQAYKAGVRQAQRLQYEKAKKNYDTRAQQSDNVTALKTVVIGTQREPTFAEKVTAVDRPPLVFKRNYSFSAECASGRKGWFSMNVNQMLSDDLLSDIQSYKSAQYTDGIASDTTVSGNSFSDNARFYIDSHKEFIKMVNSSSNSITGKIHLFCHRRDTDNAYDGAPINPINLMMYYSTHARSLNVSGAGGEQTVGNGFTFSTTAGVSNYGGLYNMPGSSLNSGGFTASTDPSLSPMSPQIKDRVGFWFRKVGESIPFSLAPGKQINQKFVFNLDKNKIWREQSEFNHLSSISYNIIVEFEGGVVGDSTPTSGDNVVSSGSVQLSVIRENERIMGVENKYRSKIVLQTAPLTQIAVANQIILNSDTGAQLIGALQDA